MAVMRLRIDLPAMKDLTPRFKVAMKAVGVEACSIIRRRTAAGSDMHGRPFKPYSDEYRLLKTATGRRGTVDLTLSGQMLGNLQVLRTEERRVVIGFTGQHRETVFGGQSRKALLTDLATKRSVGKRTLKRTDGTMPMAAVVIGNDRIRPFMGVGFIASEVEALVRVFNRVANAGAVSHSALPAAPTAAPWWQTVND